MPIEGAEVEGPCPLLSRCRFLVKLEEGDGVQLMKRTGRVGVVKGSDMIATETIWNMRNT
jgi:hypothetical protein